jgi:transcriptional regulator of acetoin/glycerol metabolism
VPTSIYQLNVFAVNLPPLRDRARTSRHWFGIRAKFTARMNWQIDVIPDEVIEALQLHDWPGNMGASLSGCLVRRCRSAAAVWVCKPDRTRCLTRN